MRSAEGPEKESGGQGRWRGNPGVQFDLPYLIPRLCNSRYVGKVRRIFCLVTGENTEESGAALRDQFLCETRKIWFRNVAVVEDSSWGCCFVFSPSPQVAQGVQGRKGSVEDEERAWRPSTSRTENNVARVKAVLDRDRRLSVRLIAEEVGLPKKDVHRIITKDLHTRKICVKLVPKNLSDEQEDNRVLLSREILDLVTSEPDFLQRVITGDATWVFEYDPTNKRQSSGWHTSQSPRPKKARMSKSRVKPKLIFFIQRESFTRSLCHLDRL